MLPRWGLRTHRRLPFIARVVVAVALTAVLLLVGNRLSDVFRDHGATVSSFPAKREATLSARQATTTAPSSTEVASERELALARVEHVQLFEKFVTNSERNLMLTLLASIDQVFTAYNVTYIMYGGTLLGSHRHLGLIPWDDDIDLLVNETFRQQLPEALKKMAPELKLHPAGGHDKISHRLSKQTGPHNWLWPYLDVSYFKENATHVWDIVPTYEHWFSYPLNLLLPLHRRPFENLQLMAPRDTLAVLQLTYGMTSTCVTSAYSHMTEGSIKSARKKCSLLSATVPFVHRAACGAGVSNCVRETLMLGDVTLRVVETREPSFALNEPYSLKYIDGVTPPPYYPIMSQVDL